MSLICAVPTFPATLGQELGTGSKISWVLDNLFMHLFDKIFWAWRARRVGVARRYTLLFSGIVSGGPGPGEMASRAAVFYGCLLVYI